MATALERLFTEVAGVLMRRARRLYSEDPAPVGLDADLFALDAAPIGLSLALFPWARWQGTQVAVKLNVLLGLRTELPALCTCLLVAIAKPVNALPGSLHQVLPVFGIAALEQATLPELFAKLSTTGKLPPYPSSGKSMVFDQSAVPAAPWSHCFPSWSGCPLRQPFQLRPTRPTQRALPTKAC